MAIYKYNVTITTQDNTDTQTYSGTDSDVYIKFYGPNGRGGTPDDEWTLLDYTGYNDFRPGVKDVYEVTGNVNGPITDVGLWLKGTDDWRPGTVVIEDVSAGLFYKADFSDAAMSDEKRFVKAVLTTQPPSPPESAFERELSLAKRWLANYSAGIAEVCRTTGASADLIIPILLLQLRKCDFNTKFVTVGGTLNVGIGYSGAIEGGGVYAIDHLELGEKVANYMTLSRGWDVSIGTSAGAVIAAWNVANVEKLDGAAMSFHLSAQAGIGFAVSAIFSPGSDAPTGVQVAMLAGPDVALGGGNMEPYTWTWPI